MYYYGIGPHRIVQKAKPVYILYTSYIRNSLKFKACCMTVPKPQLLFSAGTYVIVWLWCLLV